MRKKIEETTQFLLQYNDIKPQVGMILGSGLGSLADEVEKKIKIPYEKIPHFPVSTVEGHSGNLVFGRLNGVSVVMMQGRFHYYEGYSMEKVTFPVRVMKALGIETFIVTNASGGINESFQPGDIMLMTDHILNMGTNPLIGKNDESIGPRFPDMSQVYDKKWQTIVKKVAKRLQISLKEGVYIAVTGPSYETPAEIRMFRKFGADAVGMSSVPEVIVAGHMGLQVLGLSCITNLAAGVSTDELSHEEVIETATRVKPIFMKLVKESLKEWKQIIHHSEGEV
ncbi:MAG TPA: purine-nucleoside phosphorylase [Massilibacterium sp.]|nr:purine-nucleoside phosphorylase [Massilibacterium sp.]